MVSPVVSPKALIGFEEPRQIFMSVARAHVQKVRRLDPQTLPHLGVVAPHRRKGVIDAQRDHGDALRSYPQFVHAFRETRVAQHDYTARPMADVGKTAQPTRGPLRLPIGLGGKQPGRGRQFDCAQHVHA